MFYSPPLTRSLSSFAGLFCVFRSLQTFFPPVSLTVSRSVSPKQQKKENGIQNVESKKEEQKNVVYRDYRTLFPYAFAYARGLFMFHVSLFHTEKFTQNPTVKE